MKVTIYYKNIKLDPDSHNCKLWGIDSQNSLLKLYKENSKKVTVCFVFVRLTEILKVEIT